MILTTLIFLPLAAAVILLCIPKERQVLIRSIALAATGSVLAFAAAIACQFDIAFIGHQWMEERSWISALNIWYRVGLDGINMALVLLTGLLGVLGCMWAAREGRTKGFFILYLVLMTGVMGVFLALDLFLFYVFWEVVLIPMYFLLGVWGGPGRRHAAMKFFLYTLAGSVFMLLGILGVYFWVTPHSFNMIELAGTLPGMDFNLQILLFLAFFLGFAVKLPIFPFHTWLPEVYAAAPTSITVILAGLLAKMGGYGLIRICYTFFPESARALSFTLMTLGVITIIYAAWIAIAQKEFKRMIAYASVSHMGFVVIGLAAMNQAGMNGALLGMFNHGIIVAGLFILAAVLFDRSKTGHLDQYGGLWGSMPVFGFALMICALATVGLPGLNGFVSEFLSLIGAFQIYPWLAVLAAVALVLAAVYVLCMAGRILMGGSAVPAAVYADLTVQEISVVMPLVIIIAVVGFYPAVVLQFQEAAITALTQIF